MALIHDINDTLDKCYTINRKLKIIDRRLDDAIHAFENNSMDTARELLNHAKDDLANIGKTP